MTDKRITDIYCPNCGAPAEFDIVRQQYLCAHCGGKVEIGEAIRQMQGFRAMQREKLGREIKKFSLFHAECKGCGADVVIEENEALSVCPFCGKSMVRSAYLRTDSFPESIIPFAITETEAKELLKKWCAANRKKKEAVQLLRKTDRLKGYYLPYELVRGPVDMTVSRMDGMRNYLCRGFINDMFVNRSKQLDNLLLDGMEPYDIGALREFDFSYTAGQRVKISDITDNTLENRVKEETATTYTPAVRKVLESKSVQVDPDVSKAIRLPVLMPVYYICDGNLMAAVNGQTGKVSVRSLKESHYVFLPWWLKAIIAAFVFSIIVFLVLRLSGMNNGSAFYITGMLAVVYIIVTLCLYSDTVHNRFLVVSGKEIFTSGEKSFVREQDHLVLSDRILEKKVESLVFIEKLNGKETPVVLKFTSPLRVLRIVLLTVTGLFLPVIIALFLNGFSFSRLNLAGSAVWFCIAVPVAPVYLLKFGIVELHDRPWIYIISEDGHLKRYREKLFTGTIQIRSVLRLLFVPPECLAFWFGIICFFTMCYLTAFGW